jgi:hypothetical protein
MKLQKVKKLVKASYRNEDKNVSELKRDKSLSGKRVQVYYNNQTGQSVVVHRGTASLKDWATDAALAVGYERGNRFKHANKIQMQAEQKYGRQNVTTIGHSLGGRIAEKVGKKSSQIITYNKAATPISIREKTPTKQIDIRTKGDPVSYLSKFQKRDGKLIQLESSSYNPLYNHSTKPIPNLPKPKYEVKPINISSSEKTS